MFAGALLLGILCAWYENRLADRILCKLGTISSCIPEFWMALILILIFSVNLKILPSSGAYSTGNAGNFGDRVLHLIMPLTIIVTVSYTHLDVYKRQEEANEGEK